MVSKILKFNDDYNKKHWFYCLNLFKKTFTLIKFKLKKLKFQPRRFSE